MSTAAVLQSPAYQPTEEYSTWRELNKRALIRRWWELSTALAKAGEQLGVQADDVEFEGFCRSQFDLSRDGCSDLGSDGRAVCDEGLYCEKHYREAAAEHAWMAGQPRSVVTGELDEDQEQDLRNAGRGHLVRS